MNVVEAFENRYPIAISPPIQVGDWVKLGIRIREGEKTRIQPFEGLVIAKKGCANEKRIQVRKVFQNIGIERTFPLRAPCVATIQILKSNQPKRAKLYYLRTRTGRSAMRLRRRRNS
uniref:Ribosomal protein L19 n=1 Tax=Pseudobryopsis hainanensis TaxID=2320808 RepID=A0A3S5X3U7_9CHLO|nr:ribosomal protein L19 [Pseudobryopsis hainanensis]